MTIRKCIRYVGDEVYVVRFDDQQPKLANAALGLWAGDPELVFCWRDAAVMSHAICQFTPGVFEPQPPPLANGPATFSNGSNP